MRYHKKVQKQKFNLNFFSSSRIRAGIVKHEFFVSNNLTGLITIEKLVLILRILILFEIFTKTLKGKVTDLVGPHSCGNVN